MIIQNISKKYCEAILHTYITLAHYACLLRLHKDCDLAIKGKKMTLLREISWLTMVWLVRDHEWVVREDE